jgi:ribosomal protein L30/L7E
MPTDSPTSASAPANRGSSPSRGGRGEEQQPPRRPSRRGDIALRNEALFGAYAVLLQHKSDIRCNKPQKETLRSLKLHGIGARNLVYVSRSHLGMLRKVAPWTAAYSVSLPPKASADLLTRLRKTAVNLQTYKSSGGESEYRSYEAGEEAQVELHEHSFSVLWSAVLPAQGFLHYIRPLITDTDGSARMSTVDNQPIECSLTEGIKKIDADPGRFTFIRLDFADRAITWEAPDLSRSLGQRPYLPGQIGVICRQFEPDWLRRFLVETATPHVAADADDLVEATKRLTSHFQ